MGEDTYPAEDFAVLCSVCGDEDFWGAVIDLFTVLIEVGLLLDSPFVEQVVGP